MTRTILIFSFLFTLSSCAKVKLIGKVNMISNRNVDPTTMQYVVISTYSGGSKRELKKSRAKTIEDAIDKTVRRIPGGEFLLNAKIYSVKRKYLAVEGDVWGLESNLSYRGFKIGDKVTWKNLGNFKTGIIKSLKNDKTCLIETDNGVILEKKYDEISKAE